MGERGWGAEKCMGGTDSGSERAGLLKQNSQTGVLSAVTDWRFWQLSSNRYTDMHEDVGEEGGIPLWRGGGGGLPIAKCPRRQHVHTAGLL